MPIGYAMRVENSANSIAQISLTGKTKSASKKVVRNIEIELIRGKGQVENADFSDIADITDFFSPTFINPCFRYSPMVNIENLNFKKSEIFKHPCFRYSL